MAKEMKRKASKSKSNPRGSEPSYWMISTVIAVIFLIGFVVKTAFMPSQVPKNSAENFQTSSRTDMAIDRQVRQVASNFSCACEGCGELPLVECTCDMASGAQEEKTFIRNKLKNGLTVDQVVQLVEKKYGYRTT
jgi:enamine deaminase RidA (YjgF/YER057c/UK114 family)